MFQGMPVQRAQAIAVPLLYGLAEAICIPLYCLVAWKAGWTKAPPGEALWTVITKSYENNNDTSHQCHGHGNVAMVANHPHAGIMEELPSCDDDDDMEGKAIVSTSHIPVDSIKWRNTDSTISYSPVTVQTINTSLVVEEDGGMLPDNNKDLHECQVFLASKFARLARGDTLDTTSEEDNNSIV